MILEGLKRSEPFGSQRIINQWSFTYSFKKFTVWF